MNDYQQALYNKSSQISEYYKIYRSITPGGQNVWFNLPDRALKRMDQMQARLVRSSGRTYYNA